MSKNKDESKQEDWAVEFDKRYFVTKTGILREKTVLYNGQQFYKNTTLVVKQFFGYHIQQARADQDRISRESERQKIKKLLLEKGNGGGNWRRIIEQLIK